MFQNQDNDSHCSGRCVLWKVTFFNQYYEFFSKIGTIIKHVTKSNATNGVISPIERATVNGMIFDCMHRKGHILMDTSLAQKKDKNIKGNFFNRHFWSKQYIFDRTFKTIYILTKTVQIIFVKSQKEQIFVPNRQWHLLSPHYYQWCLRQNAKQSRLCLIANDT